MAITDDQVAVLRSMLTGDAAEYDRLTGLLDKTDGWGRYTALVAAAFFEAVDRRFGTKYTRPDIIQFVADARGRFPEGGPDLDPVAAERLILSVLEDVEIDDIDDETVVKCQVAFLTALIVDENLDAVGLGGFLENARKLADEWTDSPN